ncbi:MAG: ComF family protein [Gammaproteobacteria bacterium]|nr:ComF family protein [Gammaproteobacteria bacterium]MCZ6826838.1 ComF family protein [Gammaproteobacteria bacterium]
MTVPAMDLCADCYRDLPRLTDGCAVCARPAVGDAMICGSCQNNPPPFEWVIAPYRYAWPIDKMLQQFKFGGNLAMGRVLGRLLAHHLTSIRRRTSMPAMTEPAIIIPVPLHRRRLWQRGFNQAGELARTIGLIMPVHIRSELCVRVRNTPAQSGKRAEERHKNVRKAFALRRKTVPERIVIIDDVMTTGSTCAELARTFKSQGTRQVLVWCLARA